MTTDNQAPARPSEGLLPCPFCGGTNLHIGGNNTGASWPVRPIGCKDCGFKLGCDWDEPGKGWNRRAADPRAAPASQWIKCSERMPEVERFGYSATVLVAVTPDNGPLFVATDRWHAVNKAWEDYYDPPRTGGCHITNWMPLPAPPKETT